MNSRRREIWLVLTLGLALTSGCTPERDPATLFAPEAVGVLVVDATLIVGEPLPALRLTRTLAPDVPFTLSAAWESGATVLVTGPSGVVAYREYYEENAENGLVAAYRPIGAVIPLVAPGARYDLSAVTTRGETLTATTVTPGEFRVSDWRLLTADGTSVVRSLRTFAELGDSVYTHPDNRLDYAEGLVEGVLPQLAPGYGAAGFQVALFSLDPDAGYVINPPFFTDEDFADLPRSGSSPILNGELGNLRLPWFGVFYDGRILYKAYAVDRNWFDLERSIPQGGGSFVFGGNVGEGIDPPVFHVQGGIGLFGSAAVDSVGFFVRPLEP